MNASEEEPGDHNAARRPEAANQQRHQEPAESEFLGHRAENDDQDAEQNNCAGRAEHLLEGEIDFGCVQRGAEHAECKSK